MKSRPQVKAIDTRMSIILPDEEREFLMKYKDIVFKCRRNGNDIDGVSLLGELKLYTNVQQIKKHDIENETWTKWRYI
ncbi:hypothetical protein IH575_04550 [Candidatus Dojkabacteria bacterium]|nr:hypothetical protein [Candidatus Dojkabacteria bacterium]